MELVQAIRKDQMAALGRFAEPATVEKLNSFEGTIINLRHTILAAGFKWARPTGPGEFRRGWRGGVWTDRVPKLAVADVNWTMVEWTLDAGYGFFHGSGRAESGTLFHERKLSCGNMDNALKWRCSVPTIPREANVHTPSVRGQPNPAVLFESGDWVRGESVRPPPAMLDPAIIKHLVGDLWGVLYVWELTALEKEALKAVGL